MTPAEQKKAAKAFVKRWKIAEGNEQREANKFWIELFHEVLGVANPTHLLDFERKAKGRRIDVFYEDMGVLIENKSRGVGLDEPEQRGWMDKAKAVPRMVTPFEQAKDYANDLPFSVKPRWVITCNFNEIRIYDLNEEYPERAYQYVLLNELPEQFHRLSFLVDKTNSRLEKEKELSVKAGEVVGKLYDSFAAAYLDIENDAREQKSLNILITRIVFLLFAEDAGLLHERDAFYKYLKNFQTPHMRQALIDLFGVLKTPEEQRDPYLSPEVSAFPYVNGGLFADDIVVPQFTADTRFILLQEASADFDWSGISPTIFGAVFESTLNPETRRAGGMHYTSIENIHKLTGPLFYDDLRAELAAIEGATTEKERKFKLNAFRKKIASLKFLDPACGSGNFLTETYLSLRKLENRVLEGLYGGQMVMGLLDPIQVSLDQFYGIEINDFAVEVAKTALWIAEIQMLDQTREILDMWIDPLPLKSNDNIVCGNALRMDWDDLLPAAEASFVIGNPPFLGSSIRSKSQTDDLAQVFGDEKKWGKCDYCVGWYRKAADYMKGTECRSALVSTNSITQGEQVEPTWRRLFDMGMHIDFAYRTFIWNSEAADQARVHCVIVGFSYSGTRERTIYDEGTSLKAKNINGYLSDAPNVFLRTRSKPVDEQHAYITQGSKLVDGGNLILSSEEKEWFVNEYPDLAHLVKPLVGGVELLKGSMRFCFWLRDVESDVWLLNPYISKRLEGVRKARLESPTKEFRDAAATPWLFEQDRQPSQSYLAAPKVSSQRREYVPFAWLSPDVIATDQLWVSANATLIDFGIMSSRMHNAWMRRVAGRMKSDYRYNPVVYNTMAYPSMDSNQSSHIEGCAQDVLATREQHPELPLAKLYDPDKMPGDLKAAHAALDAAVEAAYGVDFSGDEEKIVAHLFKLYAEKTEGGR